MLIQFDKTNGDVNVGCMGLKKTENIINLFNEYAFTDYDWVKSNYRFGQQYFNYLLRLDKYSNIKKLILPLEYAGKQIKEQGLEYPEELKLYHATFEADVNSKYNTLINYKND